MWVGVWCCCLGLGLFRAFSGSPRGRQMETPLLSPQPPGGHRTSSQVSRRGVSQSGRIFPAGRLEVPAHS